MDFALFQPDIAGNVGTSLRTAACFDVGAHIIEPCGFPFSVNALKRAGMDYAERVEIYRHANWQAFVDWKNRAQKRIVLFTTKGATPLPDFQFTPNDVLLFGSESSGVPDHVHNAVDARVLIPMHPDYRSLNVAVSAGIAMAEALRQTKGFPS
jgi:tRNA (cytidine/uridine-2'-O-)-methyltransferase